MNTFEPQCECSCHLGVNYPGKCHAALCEKCGKGTGSVGITDTVLIPLGTAGPLPPMEQANTDTHIKKLQQYIDEVTAKNRPPKCNECGLSKDNYPITTHGGGNYTQVCHQQVFNSRSYIDLYLEGVKNMLDDLAEQLSRLT